MFNRKNETEDAPHILDDPIDSLIASLGGLEEGEEKYTAATADLKTLMELRNLDYDKEQKPIVSPEVLVVAGAHLLGIAMILGFEMRHVLTSKASAFVPKIRI